MGREGDDRTENRRGHMGAVGEGTMNDQKRVYGGMMERGTPDAQRFLASLV